VVLKVSEKNYPLRIYYVVRFRGRAAIFIWSSSPKSLRRSAVDLKVRVNPKEVFWLAKRLNCRFDDDMVFAPNIDVYNRLIIYAFVRPTIRNNNKARELGELVINMSYVDAYYWASMFREVWWNYGNHKSGLKHARSFKLLFLNEG